MSDSLVDNIIEIQDIAGEIVEERLRQIIIGHKPSGDLGYIDGELRKAAAALALHDEELWPWDTDTYKGNSSDESLIKAAALIIAELQRRKTIWDKS